jgi:hypothetical protein
VLSAVTTRTCSGERPIALGVVRGERLDVELVAV